MHSAFQPGASGFRQPSRTGSLIPVANGEERRAEAKISCKGTCDFCTCSIRPSPSEEPPRPTLLAASEPLTSSAEPQTCPEVPNTFAEPHGCLEGCRGHWRNRSQPPCAFLVALLSGCASLLEKGRTRPTQEWPLPGDQRLRRDRPTVPERTCAGAAGEAGPPPAPPLPSGHAGLGSSHERDPESGLWRRNTLSRC